MEIHWWPFLCLFWHFFHAAEDILYWALCIFTFLNDLMIIVLVLFGASSKVHRPLLKLYCEVFITSLPLFCRIRVHHKEYTPRCPKREEPIKGKFKSNYNKQFESHPPPGPFFLPINKTRVISCFDCSTQGRRRKCKQAAAL